jgi:hypothetical protein
MSGTATYTILLDPDPEDGGYTVTVSALVASQRWGSRVGGSSSDRRRSWSNRNPGEVWVNPR